MYVNAALVVTALMMTTEQRGDTSRKSARLYMSCTCNSRGWCGFLQGCTISNSSQVRPISSFPVWKTTEAAGGSILSVNSREVHPGLLFAAPPFRNAVRKKKHSSRIQAFVMSRKATTRVSVAFMRNLCDLESVKQLEMTVFLSIFKGWCSVIRDTFRKRVKILERY